MSVNKSKRGLGYILGTELLLIQGPTRSNSWPGDDLCNATPRLEKSLFHLNETIVRTELSSLGGLGASPHLSPGMTSCGRVVTVCSFCKEVDEMVFRKDEKRPELDIMDIRSGQNLEQNWYSGTGQVHKNDHN
jgi:hypothetical protein